MAAPQPDHSHSLDLDYSRAASARFDEPAGTDGLGHHQRSLRSALECARDTRDLRIGSGVVNDTAAVLRTLFPDRKALVVADGASFRVAGRAVQEHLARHGLAGPEPYIFSEPNLPAEHSFVQRLEDVLRAHNPVPVAVGSGTINDLVKLASHRTNRNYLCVATAASMDGYTAFGASITFEGAKQTFPCPAPLAVIADTDFICRAPPEMTAAGYADLLAKVTAGADWIVADALGVEPIESTAWALVQGGLRNALADPAGARAGRADAILPLVEGLMLGGFAMQWSQSSRPASGAEHQFSHLWDMEGHTHNGHAPSHGFKVGIATLLVTGLYEQLLKLPFESLDVDRVCASWPEPDEAERHVRNLFADDDFIETAVRETAAKHVPRDELRVQLMKLRSVWPDLKSRLQRQLIPLVEVRQRLEAVGAPTDPEQIGLSGPRVRRSFLRAMHIRRRFTVLDLAVRAGCFADCLDASTGLKPPFKSVAAPGS